MEIWLDIIEKVLLPFAIVYLAIYFFYRRLKAHSKSHILLAIGCCFILFGIALEIFQILGAFRFLPIVENSPLAAHILGGYLGFLPGAAFFTLALISFLRQERRKFFRLLDILDTMRNFVVIKDSDYNIRFMNKALRERFGDRVGQKCYRLFSDSESHCPEECPIRAILFEGRENFIFQPRDKEGRWYESSATPMIMPDGSKAIIEVLSDITEKKKAEHAILELTKALEDKVTEKTLELSRSEERYRSLIENANDAIFTIDPNKDRILSANRMAERITGYKINELSSMKNSQLYPSGEFNRISKKLLESVIGSGIFNRVEMIRKDGGRVPVDISANIVSFGNRKIIQAICRDMRGRLETEERMMRLASVVEGMAESVILTGLDRKIIYVNPAGLKMLGYRLEEMVGHFSTELFEGVPGNPPDLSGAIERESRSGHWEGEFFNRKKSREIIPMYLRMSTIKNEKGETIGYAGISEDITRRKQLEAELIQREKLSALGELISGVAHELNNPLTGVLGYAEIIQQSNCPKELRQDVDKLHKEALRCQYLVKNLLSFARRPKLQKEYSDINRVIENAIALKANRLEADGIKLSTQLDRNIPTVLIDPYRMQQVFTNIINNAHAALTEKRGKRRIKISSAFKNKTITVTISNNGHSIPKDRIGKIFDPFFTTKEVGQGTGLGLSISFGIVKGHGGGIHVSSKPGKETIFTVEIPLSSTQTG